MFFTLILFGSFCSAQNLPAISVEVTESVCSEYTLRPGGFIFSRTGDLSQELDFLIALDGSSSAVNGIAKPGVDYFVHFTEVLSESTMMSYSPNAESYTDVVGILEFSAGVGQIFLQVIPMFDDLVEPSERIIIRMVESPEAYTIEGNSVSEFTLKDRNFENWKEHFLNASALPLEDPDNDGIANLLEYSLVTDPTHGGGGKIIDSYLVKDGNGKRLGIKFRRLKASSDIGYSLEKYGEGSWIGVPHHEVIIEDKNDGTEIVVFYESAPVDEINSSMIRLKVTELLQ